MEILKVQVWKPNTNVVQARVAAKNDAGQVIFGYTGIVLNKNFDKEIRRVLDELERTQSTVFTDTPTDPELASGG